MQLVKTPSAKVTPVKLLLWAFGLASLGTLMYLAPTTSAWVLVLATGLAGGAWLMWRHSEMGLLAISGLGASLIPRDQIVYSLGRFNLDPADVILLGLLVCFVVRGLRQKAMVIPRWSIIGPLIAFAGFAMFSALYALFYQSVNPTLIVGELRPAIYFVGCAIIAATIAQRQQLMILLVGLFVIADLTAGAVILHQFARSAPSPVGVPLSGDWQINPFGIGGGFGSVRVVPPGHVLMYLMVNVAFCLMLCPPKIRWSRTVLALHVAFLGLALVLTYTRAQWVASGIALLLICACLPRATKRSLGRLVVFVPVLVVPLWLGASGLLPSGGTGVPQVLASRVTSIVTPSDTLSTDSLEWRAFENDAAITSLSAHPFLGVGLGNDYREITLLQGEASGWLWQLGGNSRLTRFIHDSYLYVAVKMGLPALGVFLWFCVAFLTGGARIYFKLPDSTEKFVVLAIVGSFAGLLEWVVFEAHLMLPSGLITLGLMVGLVAAVGSRFRLDQNVGDKYQLTRPAECVE